MPRLYGEMALRGGSRRVARLLTRVTPPSIGTLGRWNVSVSGLAQKASIPRYSLRSHNHLCAVHSESNVGCHLAVDDLSSSGGRFRWGVFASLSFGATRLGADHVGGQLAIASALIKQHLVVVDDVASTARARVPV